MKERPTIEQRFWRKVDKTTSCWNWTAAKMENGGHGEFRIDGTMRLAHRVSWKLKHGKWPDFLLCHSCDNPACVNPDHLFEGTQADNMEDMRNKGRGYQLPPVKFVGESNGQAKLTREIVLLARQAHAAGRSVRSIAKEYGVSQPTMRFAVMGKTWGHV